MHLEKLRNKYEFTRDDHCITLYKIGTVKDETSKNFGEKVLHLVGHFSGVDGLLRKILFLELISEGSLTELLSSIKNVNTQFSGLLTELTKEFN